MEKGRVEAYHRTTLGWMRDVATAHAIGVHFKTRVCILVAKADRLGAVALTKPGSIPGRSGQRSK